MLDKSTLIDEINSSCKMFFNESSFFLRQKSTKFVVSGDITSNAVNRRKNTQGEVTVIKWFDNFWIYLEIQFIRETTFISLSVFQGIAEDDEKTQLFRAEWDDFNNLDKKHAQPHWHITSNQAIENTFEQIASVDNSDIFMEILEEEKSKVIDITRMHFAMNGNWGNNPKHVHSITSNSQIVQWFMGLFSHLREELKYASK